GWGTRPDGATLHVNQKACQAFMKKYWDSQPSGPAPDEYTRPCGEAYEIEVSEDLYAKVVAAGNGLHVENVSKAKDANGFTVWKVNQYKEPPPRPASREELV